MTITVLTLLKRREGMSKADFIAYYETRHRLIGEKVLSGWATRYVRKHLHARDGIEDPGAFDVVLEIDFPDQATCDACFAAMADPATMAEIIADEHNLFDRASMRTFSVQACHSQLPPL
ncbi:MAG: EthD domain-containing protein [Novosphingobium sp.]|nr:EthD domain-containing protein [Novosphingobium sp.]